MKVSYATFQDAGPSEHYQTTKVSENIPQRNGFASRLKKRSLICLTIFLGCCLIYFTLQRRYWASLASSNGVEEASETVIVASNEYGQYQGAYPWISSGSQLVEPFKQSTLFVSGGLLERCSTSCDVRWSLHGTAQSYVLANGRMTSLTLRETGAFTLSVAVTNVATNEVIEEESIVLFSKYVRRELRSLTEDDRERFLNAMFAIWKYSDGDGKAMFGDAFVSIRTLTEEHALASDNISCDAFHDGTGFVTKHLALTSIFEGSLRAVDPAVSLHYWDYTIEGQAIADAGEEPSYLLNVTEILSDRWFGAVDTDDHILGSRWDGLEMLRASESSVVSPNSFGFIRSYWNNNNDPLVVRHLFDCCGVAPEQKPIPACSDHFNLINTSTLQEFLLLAPNPPHGPMHVQLGGVGGPCEEQWESFKSKWSDLLEAEFDEAELKVLADLDPTTSFSSRSDVLEFIIRKLYHTYRMLRRSHMCSSSQTPAMLQCPESCSEDTPLSECSCGIPGVLDGSIGWKDVFSCIVEEALYQRIVNTSFSEEFLNETILLIANLTLIEGEMIEAGAPMDPLFWIIHPALDRVLSAKRLSSVNHFGNSEFAKWSSGDEVWTTYSFYSFDPGVNKAYPGGVLCEGHASDDAVLPNNLKLASQFIELADVNGDGVVSNWEYYLATDPNNASLIDSVYDTLEWRHCRGDR